MRFNLKKIDDINYVVRNVINGKLIINNKNDNNDFGCIIDKEKKVEQLKIGPDVYIGSLEMENLKTLECYLDSISYNKKKPDYLPNLTSIKFDLGNKGWLLASKTLFYELDSLKRIYFIKNKNVVSFTAIPDGYKCNSIKMDYYNYDIVISYSNQFREITRYINLGYSFNKNSNKIEQKQLNIKDDLIVDNTLVVPNYIDNFFIKDISNLNDFKFNKILFHEDIKNIDITGINSNVTCLEIRSNVDVKVSKDNNIRQIILNTHIINIPNNLTVESIINNAGDFIIEAKNIYEKREVHLSKYYQLEKNFLKKLKPEHIKNNIIKIPSIYDDIKLTNENIFNNDFKFNLSEFTKDVSIRISSKNMDAKADLILPSIDTKNNMSIDSNGNIKLNKLIIGNNKINSLDNNEMIIDCENILVTQILKLPKYYVIFSNNKSIIIDRNYNVYKIDYKISYKNYVDLENTILEYIDNPNFEDIFIDHLKLILSRYKNSNINENEAIFRILNILNKTECKNITGDKCKKLLRQTKYYTNYNSGD